MVESADICDDEVKIVANGVTITAPGKYTCLLGIVVIVITYLVSR